MSEGDKRRDNAAAAIYIVGGLSAVVGLIALLLKIEFLQKQGIGIWSVITGGIFLFLGYKVKNRSTPALYAAIALYSLECLFALFTMIQQKAPAATGGLFVRGYLLYMMIRGILPSSNEGAPIASRPTAPAANPSSSPARQTTPSPRLSGESEKRRLEISNLGPKQSYNPAQIPGEFRRFDIAVKDSVAIAASALRFVVFRCQIESSGIKAIYSNGRSTILEWQNMGSICVRQLPPEKPWEGKLLLDILPVAPPGIAVSPIRIFAATYVNYSALPGGQASHTAENIRRLAAHLLQQNPSIHADPTTLAFINKEAPASKFQHVSQFAEYDSRFK